MSLKSSKQFCEFCKQEFSCRQSLIVHRINVHNSAINENMRISPGGAFTATNDGESPSNASNLNSFANLCGWLKETKTRLYQKFLATKLFSVKYRDFTISSIKRIKCIHEQHGLRNKGNQIYCSTFKAIIENLPAFVQIFSDVRGELQEKLFQMKRSRPFATNFGFMLTSLERCSTSEDHFYYLKVFEKICEKYPSVLLSGRYVDLNVDFKASFNFL